MALNDYRKATPVSGKMADFSDAPKVNKSKFIASEKSIELDGGATRTPRKSQTTFNCENTSSLAASNILAVAG